MRRAFTLLVVAAFALVLSGCGDKSVENKYDQDRADQKDKTSKMIESESSGD